MVTLSVLPAKSVALAAAINAAIWAWVAGSAAPSTETIVIGAATETAGPTVKITVPSAVASLPVASEDVKVTTV